MKAELITNYIKSLASSEDFIHLHKPVFGDGESKLVQQALSLNEVSTYGKFIDEFEKELDTMANWQLHETYSYLAFEGMLPRTSFMLIGFEWEKFDYHVIGSQELTSPAVVVNKVADRLMKDSIDA